MNFVQPNDDRSPWNEATKNNDTNLSNSVSSMESAFLFRSFSSFRVHSPRLSLFYGLKNLRKKNRTYFSDEISFDLVFLSPLIVFQFVFQSSWSEESRSKTFCVLSLPRCSKQRPVMQNVNRSESVAKHRRHTREMFEKIPKRYILCLFAFTGLTFLGIVRSALAIAIVAMVKRPNKHTNHSANSTIEVKRFARTFSDRSFCL